MVPEPMIFIIKINQLTLQPQAGLLKIQIMAMDLMVFLNATSGTVYTDNVRTAVTGTNLAGSSTLVTSSASGFSVGDEVLIITMVDKATSNNTVGQHEFNTISSISGNTITLASNKTHAYTASSSQKHQVLKVPNYTSVTVASGVTLTCHSWDGSSGGILAFRANGSVTNSGTITVSEKGYRGIGHASSLSGNAHWRNKDGAQGEGIYGTGYAGGNSSGANNATWNGVQTEMVAAAALDVEMLVVEPVVLMLLMVQMEKIGVAILAEQEE